MTTANTGGYSIAQIESAPTVDPEEDEWTPFKMRELTDEEKEMQPDADYMLDCKLPEDGQGILITVKRGDWKNVMYDEYYEDGGMSYLDSGLAIGEEAIAWRPMPKPYKGGKE
jgi:hypothetical protein